MLGREFARITSFTLIYQGDERLAAEGLRVLAAVREEPGCLHYDVYRSTDKSQFFVHELWDTDEAFERHRQSPIAAHLRSLLMQYAGSSVEEWDLELVAV